eukprot:7339583-Karenia_brevis.AAC.1
MQNQVDRVQAVARWLGQVTVMANEFLTASGDKIRDTSAVSSLRTGRRRRQAQVVELRPVQLGGHRLTRLD